MQKIMFTDRYGLTQAVIEGRKTMTRREVPWAITEEWMELVSDTPRVDGVYVPESEKDFYERKAPRYKVGEVVAVAQSYKNIGYSDTALDKDPDDVLKIRGSLGQSKGWNNKLFVRAELMLRRIRITGVHCERLQDISDADCLKEGIRYIPQIGKFYFEDVLRKEGFYFDDHREAFAALIDKVSGRGTWKRNPWVVVYEFKVVE